MKTAGIVVNYRTPELTVQVVNALRAEMRALEPFCIYLVDNASGDKSIPFFKEAAERDHWQGEVELIEAPRNGGFGYGINQAVRRALALEAPPDYFYILNSDAFADPGSLPRLVAFLDSHPDAGLAGSHIRGTDGSTQVSRFRFPSVWSEIETSASVGLLTRLLRNYVVSQPVPTSDCEVDWISGTSMLVRRTTFEKSGLFDEGYFLYFEEIDFCHSARKAGFKSYFVADAPITHIGAVSTGMVDETRRMPTYWFDSRYRYFRKHHGAAYATACDVARAVGLVIWHTKERALGRPGRGRPRMLRDFVSASWKNLLRLGRTS
ncbi:MAG TPA: glycosyltransferase family 2 protein [Polyangia bacterium]